MAKPKQEKKAPERKRSILGSLFSRPERDKEYISDLQNQWVNMDSPARVKFVIGAVFGLVVFITALVLVLYLLSLIRR
jgi:hypothetical protein